VKGEVLSRLCPAGKSVFAEPHQLAASAQAMRVDVGREVARAAGRLEQGEARVDLRQIGAGLREALFVLGDCANDFIALPAKRSAGANFSHVLTARNAPLQFLVAFAPGYRAFAIPRTFVSAWA
jgi:hypothetical protein